MFPSSSNSQRSQTAECRLVRGRRWFRWRARPSLLHTSRRSTPSVSSHGSSRTLVTDKPRACARIESHKRPFAYNTSVGFRTCPQRETILLLFPKRLWITSSATSCNVPNPFFARSGFGGGIIVVRGRRESEREKKKPCGTATRSSNRCLRRCTGAMPMSLLRNRAGPPHTGAVLPPSRRPKRTRRRGRPPTPSAGRRSGAAADGRRFRLMTVARRRRGDDYGRDDRTPPDRRRPRADNTRVETTGLGTAWLHVVPAATTWPFIGFSRDTAGDPRSRFSDAVSTFFFYVRGEIKKPITAEAIYTCSLDTFESNR